MSKSLQRDFLAIKKPIPKTHEEALSTLLKDPLLPEESLYYDDRKDLRGLIDNNPDTAHYFSPDSLPTPEEEHLYDKALNRLDEIMDYQGVLYRAAEEYKELDVGVDMELENMMFDDEYSRMRYSEISAPYRPNRDKEKDEGR